MNHLKIYLNFTLILFLAGAFSGVDAKCSLASVDAESGDRTIAYVCLHGDLKDLDEVPNEAEWIEFTVTRFDIIPADAFSRFHQLRKLTFFNCKLNELNPDAFRNLHHLEWLIFFNTKLGVAKASVFKHIPNLTVLKLDGTGLMYIEPEIFEILSKRLEVLSIRNNDLDCLPVKSLGKVERLKVLKIDENPWLCDCRRALLKFIQERKIQQVSDNDFTHHRRKRWHTSSSWYTNQSYAVSSNHRIYDCMATSDYPPLPPVGPSTAVNDYYYRKRIEWREVTTTSLSYLDQLLDDIGWLEIYNLRIPILRRYTFFRFGNTLRSITLRNCGIENIEPEAFAGLHKLERLTLIGARLPVVANYWFRDLGRLTDLILENDYIEKFDYGALDHLINLKRLDLKLNKLSCLPDDAIRGLTALEHIDASGNPWLCSCRQDLENNLLRRRIGYEISNSRMDGISCLQEGEVIRQNDYEAFYNYTSSGTIRWSWGYETHLPRPTRPPYITPRPPPVIQTTTPSVHHGGCHAVPAGRYYKNSYYNHLQGHTYICSQSSLVDLRQLPSITETIILSNSVIHTLRSDEFRRFDGFLKRLEFHDCSINEIENRAFAGIRNLEILVIKDNDIDVVRSEWFTELRNLQHLDLSKNNINRIDNGVFEILQQLVTIDISDNAINCIGTEKLEKLRYLRELHLSGNPWTCLCANRLYHLVNSRNLYCANTCLNDVLKGDGASNWGGCRISGFTPRPGTTATPSPPPPMPSTSPYPDIPIPSDYTNVSGSCFSDNNDYHYHCSNGGRFQLDKIPSWVTSIELYDSYIPHLPAATFSRFENLTELVLRNCSLREIDSRAFYGLHRLEKLVIKDNKFAVVKRDWFSQCDNLIWLDLSNNYLMEIESGAFEELKNLQYLNLEGNMFSCIYTSPFVYLPRLDTLEFSRNPLKWRCWQELRQFLELRAIGYTDHKCPYDSKALVRNLQNDISNQPQSYTDGATTNYAPYVHLITSAAILYTIY